MKPIKFDKHVTAIGDSIGLLALSLLPGVGYWTIRDIYKRTQSFINVLRDHEGSLLEEHLHLAKCKSYKKAAKHWKLHYKDVKREANQLYHKLKNDGIQIVFINDEKFPEKLKHINEPPYWLFIQGPVENLTKKSIAVVGTRTPDDDGIFLADYLGHSFSQFKASIVSGLAPGIDNLAHQYALKYRIPTIAFLGTGILFDFPTGSGKMKHAILSQGGAIVSEYLPFQSYSAENFVRRNRLQAGVANITIPVRWNKASGTAHTVKYAIDAGCPVFCLRLPNWRKEHAEIHYAETLGAKIFTIPREHEFLVQSVLDFCERAEPLISDLPLWANVPNKNGVVKR